MATAQHLLMAVGFLALVFGTGAAFTLGVAFACRWMAWAPINIVVNNYKNAPGL